MRKLHSKRINKIVITIIAIIMLCNFVMPNISYADTDTDDGGDFLDDLLGEFLCFLPDVVNNILQHALVSEKDIEVEDDKYEILYSPGTIFSGQVPAFDINFIEPMDDKEDYSDYTEVGTYITEDKNFQLVAEGVKYYMSNSYCADDDIVTEDINQDIWSKIEQFFGDGEQLGAYKNFWDLDNEEITIAFSNSRKITIRLTTNKSNLNIKAIVVSIDDIPFTVNEEGYSEEEDNDEWPYGYGVVYENSEQDVNDANIERQKFELALYYLMSGDYSKELQSDTDRIYEKLMAKYEEIKNMNPIPTISVIDFVHHCERSKHFQQKFIIEYNPESENCWKVYYVDFREFSNLDVHTYRSTAGILQPIVSSWYKGLRRIALVFLLSVLAYLGIRIVLSSTSAKDKAKYKNMLRDWLVAICLLFTLHYIMAITITVVDKISEITAVNGVNGEDILVSSIRNSIADADEFFEVIVQVIIYVVITIYTVIFTIQYFRRTIYLAFLTMIAPLITLTYPLDKIKDSKAQAFDMWLKDYIFFSLLQVVHSLIYWVFVGISIDMSNQKDWIFALVAIGFLTHAEKFIKNMFGFQKSSTVNAVAAGATGALVMNAINKLKFGSPKGAKGAEGSSGEGGSPKGVRTTNGDPLAGLRTAGAGNQGGGGTPGQQQQNQVAGQGGQNGGGGTPTQQPQVQPQNQGIPANLNQSNKPKIKPFSGVGSLAKKYTGPVLSKMAGIGLGGAGALIGFSAGVAQGDIGKALTGATAGGAAGYHGGQKLGNAGANMITGATFGNLKNKWNNVTDTFNEGARGKEYVQNVRFDREFYKSEGYKKLMEDHEGTPKETIQDMLDVGITDPKDMDKILTNSTGGTLAEEIGYYTLAKDCDNGVFYDDEKLGKYLEGKLGIEGIGQEDIEAIYDKMKKYK